ncbi:hypothetical protein [Bergeyella sp. RCAD1439]|uniref:hypothetical protein n=1 Tax=Bergeyella anatis TaxID=3113737 RepID=UPI002E190387|nr:hypothetical protein [Bergeyella sp. RCAD1439]
MGENRLPFLGGLRRLNLIIAMKHKVFIWVFMIMSLGLGAQEAIVFKTRYLPNTTYEVEFGVRSKFYMDFEGDEAFMKALKSKGVELPMVGESSILALSEMETKSQEGNSLPFVTTYKKVEKSQSIGEVREDRVRDALEGMRFYGSLENGNEMRVDSIQNSRLDEATKQFLKTYIEELTQKINFPDQPLKIGEAFEQNVPMAIPLGGMGTLSFVINIKYTLKSVKGTIAFFDIKTDFILNSDLPDLTLESNNGHGSGVLEYDIVNHFTRSHTSNYTFELTVRKADFKVRVKAESESVQKMKLK